MFLIDVDVLWPFYYHLVNWLLQVALPAKAALIA